MELDNRKFKILEAVIQDYLRTGEPVGSRTIAKISDLSLSSATIRNEMADLEEMGYIVQPHTSAGRVPTDKGYRLYVDSILAQKAHAESQRDAALKKREKELENIKKEYASRLDRMEDVKQAVARTLANDTNYATMISTASGRNNKIKFVQLSRVEEKKLLVVIVMEGNVIRNKVFRVSETISEKNILRLNMMLNTTVTGLSVEQLEERLSAIEAENGNQPMLREVLNIIFETVRNADDVQIVTGGTTNIFKYPELSVSEIARDLITTLEDKQGLSGFLETVAPESEGIRFYIGEETPVKSMRDCSVVTASYELSDGTTGTIGIIGPKRMDYEMVVETLNNIRMRLDDLFSKN